MNFDNARLKMIIWVALTQTVVMTLQVAQTVVQVGYLPTLDALRSASQKPAAVERTDSPFIALVRTKVGQ
jgi:hypothetical protein